MTIQTSIAEKPRLKILRVLSGMGLAIQGVTFFFVLCFCFVMIMLVGSLSFLSGSGATTNEQMEATGTDAGVMLLYPFLWTFMLELSAVNILLRKRPVLIIVLCLLSILSEIGMFVFLGHMNELSLESFTTIQHAGFNVPAILAMLIPLAGIIVAGRDAVDDC